MMPRVSTPAFMCSMPSFTQPFSVFTSLFRYPLNRCSL